MKTASSIYSDITEKIIHSLKNGTPPWQQPWNSPSLSLPLRHNGIAYRGINTLILWFIAQEKQYRSTYWMTFKQAKALNGSIRKGQKGTKVVYAAAFTKTSTNTEGEEIEEKIPFLKTYTVFNANQVDGLPDHFQHHSESTLSPKLRIEHCERFFRNTKANIKHDGNEAYFSHNTDQITLPQFENFHSPEAYYAILGHEMVHWTGHKNRLDRKLLSFLHQNQESYAFEELIAELGSAFLNAHLGLATEPREDHANYIAHWLKTLKNDHRAIFRAASQAQNAVDYLINCQQADSA